MMKPAVILMIIMILIAGCSIVKISGTADLILDERDLQEIGMRSSEIDCYIEEYETSEHSPLMQYCFCNFTIDNLNDTEVALEFKKFTNLKDLNRSYQYDSLHYFSVEGLIRENDFGDQSRFRVNNENDYMGYLDVPGLYNYNLWICKDLYMIHITSKGTEEAEDYIAKIGRKILEKFR